MFFVLFPICVQCIFLNGYYAKDHALLDENVIYLVEYLSILQSPSMKEACRFDGLSSPLYLS